MEQNLTDGYQLITGVDFVRHDGHDVLYRLRREAYQNEYQDQVNVDGLRPTDFEARFLNLGIYDRGQLVSVLRIAPVDNVEDYRRIMLIDFEPEHLSLPLVILGRAATKPGFESQGLHTLLRFHAFHLAKCLGVKWIVGTFKADAKRMVQLGRMGYQFSINENRWDKVVKVDEPTIVARMDIHHHFDRAVSVMKGAADRLSFKFPLMRPYEDILQFQSMSKIIIPGHSQDQNQGRT